MQKSSRHRPVRALRRFFGPAILLNVCLCSILLQNGQASQGAEPQKPGKPQAGKHKAWLIKEETSSNGRYEFLIAREALSIKCQAFGFRVLSQAPDWKITVVRDKEREIATCTLTQWKQLSVPSFTMAGIAKELNKPDQRILIKNSSPQRLKLSYAVKEKPMLAWRNGATPKTSQDDMPVRLVELETFLLPCACQTSLIITKLLNLPAIEGIPASFFCVYENGSRGWQIKTVSIAEVEARSSDFALDRAVSYQNKGTVNQAFLGKSAMSKLEGLTDLMETK